MIYNKKHKLIFIHIPKNAGSSIIQGLLNTSKKESRKYTYEEHKELASSMRFGKRDEAHANAIRVQRLIGVEEWNSCWSFCIVRNPWDRLVSKYSHQKSLEENVPEFKKWLLGGMYDIKLLRTQYSYIVDKSGDKVIDTVFFFERLSEVKPAIEKYINEHFCMPHENKTKHALYRKYYDDETQQYVSGAYAEDIEKFGYEF